MKALAQIIAITIVIVLEGCNAPPTSQPGPATVGRDPGLVLGEVLARIQAINFEDGVDAKEANVLAEHYFRNVYGTCGMWGPVLEQKEAWYFPCATGYIATEKPGITITKSSGRITCRRGPDIDDPALLAKPFDPIWPRHPLRPQSK